VAFAAGEMKPLRPARINSTGTSGTYYAIY
jgi:hypothetical protein